MLRKLSSKIKSSSHEIVMRAIFNLIHIKLFLIFHETANIGVFGKPIHPF